MTPPARIAAAIEILSDVEARHRPAADALKDWGLAHRFAGSSDRAALAGLVYDALRVRASSQARLGDETPRAAVLGMLGRVRGLDVVGVAALVGEGRFAAPPLSERERAALASPLPDDAPAAVLGDFPAWLEPALFDAFGSALVPELQSFAARAPLDLRVNALKALRRDVLAELAPLGAVITPHSPLGLRIEPREDGRGPAIQSDPEFIKGRVEVQDEGSQLAALLAGAKEGWQVLDLCAGGGGKTLALAAAMNNRGQIHATDNDARRLAPIHARLERAGARNVQVHTPRGRFQLPAELENRMNLVLVDAPCTGTGTWRRNPDAKWRIRPGSVTARLSEQRTALDEAARFVRPGGRLLYVTCSVLPAENGEQIAAFLARRPGFTPIAPRVLAEEAGLGALAEHVDPSGAGVLLTPHRTGTDGFFIAALGRSA